jgi:Carboxypeptidase regulatory-like domain
VRIGELIFLSTILAFAVPPAWGQSSAGIRGQVLDPSGGAVSGATVLVTNTTTGATVRRATTGADGKFEIKGLAPLQYLVTVVKPGFAAFSGLSTIPEMRAREEAVRCFPARRVARA